MSQVINFYRKQPAGISVNGESISAEAIDAITEQFADAPKPREAAARALVVRTLLRQQAIRQGIEADNEEGALERLIEQEVPAAEVSDDEVRRYFDGNRDKFRSGDLFEVRHILFELAPNDDKTALARKADAVLLAIKNDPEAFERIAREQSACSSAALGGSLGQITRDAVVPEFWSALVGQGKPGLLPHPVESRFGLHIIRIDRCALGEALPFEAVENRIRPFLAARLEQVSYQRYIARLIEAAQIVGIDLGEDVVLGTGHGLPSE